MAGAAVFRQRLTTTGNHVEPTDATEFRVELKIRLLLLTEVFHSFFQYTSRRCFQVPTSLFPMVNTSENCLEACDSPPAPSFNH